MRASRFLLALILVLALVLEVPNSLSEPVKVTVKKEVVYNYTLDIKGKVISYYIRVKIVIKSDIAEKLTIIDKIGNIDIDSLKMLSGPKPSEVTETGNGTCMLLWSDVKLEKGYIVLEYMASVKAMPEFEVKVDITSSNGTLNYAKYVFENVNEGDVVNLKIGFKSNPGEYLIVDGEKIVYPYIALFVLTHPKNMLDSLDYLPRPNMTASQEDNMMAYWNVILKEEMYIEASLLIKSLGAWKSIWINPITIQLIDDPWAILANLRRYNIEELLNETLASYNELKKTMDTIDEMKESLNQLADAMETIGEKEMEAARLLLNLTNTIRGFLDVLDSVSPENISRAISEAKNAINNTIDMLSSIEEYIENSTYAENMTEVVERINQSIELLEQMYSLLSEANVESIYQVIGQLESTVATGEEASSLLLSSGEMHLKLARIIRNEYLRMMDQMSYNLSAKLDYMEERIRELNKTYKTVKAYEKLANERIEELNRSIEIYYNGTEVKASKTFSVKHIVAVKLPILASKIEVSGTPGGGLEEEEEKRVPYELLIVPIAIIVVLTLYLRRPRKPVPREEIEKRIIKEIEELEKELLK